MEVRGQIVWCVYFSVDACVFLPPVTYLWN
jgi:hypothetical protein